MRSGPLAYGWKMTPEEQQARRMKAMTITRDLCEWTLGDRKWADRIVAAYEDPEGTKNWLKAEGYYDD